MLNDILKSFGGIALFFIILAASRYLVMSSFFLKYNKYPFIKEYSKYINKYHKYFGMLALFFAIFHSFGMIKYLKNPKLFMWFGLAALVDLFIVGLMGMLVKKVSSNHKRIIIKIHMLLAGLLVILALLHVIL
ncbi:hypothetical protein H3N56_00595 [Cetobacterium sp. 2A]|uniref:hypothetical protein n=1 Tax=unclassified Cetobacterium TaxID=2630983 RepID=UPI00163BF1D8|nr:hypothetical protein [Cetobacterium sp. 2A]MBC2854995.1 hypothetical protein [Cetobacterium sp. 2A]